MRIFAPFVLCATKGAFLFLVMSLSNLTELCCKNFKWVEPFGIVFPNVHFGPTLQ